MVFGREYVLYCVTGRTRKYRRFDSAVKGFVGQLGAWKRLKTKRGKEPPTLVCIRSRNVAEKSILTYKVFLSPSKKGYVIQFHVMVTHGKPEVPHCTFSNYLIRRSRWVESFKHACKLFLECCREGEKYLYDRRRR